MRTAENKETIRRIYAALEHGDRSVFGASVHPDYIWRFPGHCSWSKRFSGQEEVRNRLLKPLFALFATEYKAKAINVNSRPRVRPTKRNTRSAWSWLTWSGSRPLRSVSTSPAWGPEPVTTVPTYRTAQAAANVAQASATVGPR